MIIKDDKLKVVFDSETHIYRSMATGNIIPSVTNIMREGGILKCLHDVPVHILEQARQFGTAVHAAIHLFNTDNLKEETLDENLKPYLDVYMDFLEEHKVRVIKSEQVVYNQMFGYAGQYDLYAEVDDCLTLLDIKTSHEVDKKSNSVQLSAYRAAVNENIAKLSVLHLKSDKYKLIELQDNMDVFLSALHIYKFKNDGTK